MRTQTKTSPKNISALISPRLLSSILRRHTLITFPHKTCWPQMRGVFYPGHGAVTSHRTGGIGFLPLLGPHAGNPLDLGLLPHKGFGRRRGGAHDYFSLGK